jgi:hypothetical protein
MGRGAAASWMLRQAPSASVRDWQASFSDGAYRSLRGASDEAIQKTVENRPPGMVVLCEMPLDCFAYNEELGDSCVDR